MNGEDSDGLINQMTLKTKALGGVWLASKLTHLDGYIAGLLKVEIDDARMSEFKAMTQEFAEIQFSIYDATEHADEPRPSIRLIIEGEDRSGLNSEITQLLYDQDVRVIHFQSHRFPVVGLGTGVFEAKLEVELPPSMTTSSLKTLIESLDEQLRVFFGKKQS